MKLKEVVIKLLIEAFAEECIEEINRMKRADVADVFNFGIASADAAVRRTKTKWIEKLKNQEEDYVND